MSANGCEIKYHESDKVNKIIKELSYGNSADGYRILSLIKEPAFTEYWKNDKTAGKSKSLDDIPERTLRRIIREYRNSHTFGIKNNTTVKNNTGYYAFKSKDAYNVGKTYLADSVYNLYSNYMTEAQRKSKDAVNLAKGGVKSLIKTTLAKRLNKYDANNKFDKNTPIQDLVNYAYNNDFVEEQDKNYADLVYSAYSSAAFWQEAFQTSKVVNLGIKLTDEDVADKESMNELNEDDIENSEISDGIDEMTKQWDVDKTYNNFGKHVSEANRITFNSLVKLSSPNYNAEGKTFDTQYSVDTSNALGVPTYHTYQEVMIELSDVVESGGWKSIDEFIAGVEEIANKKRDFYGLIQLVNRMKKDRDFAYGVYKDVDKYNCDVFEIDIDEYGIESVQTNTRNTSARQIYYGLRNSIKNTALQLDNFSINNDIADINKLIANYEKAYNAGGSYTVKTPKGDIKVDGNILLNRIAQSIKDIYGSYFPNFDITAIDRYIINNNNRPDILTFLTSNLSALVAGASKTAETKRQRDYTTSRINARNWKKRMEAINAGEDPNSLTYEQLPKYDEDYIQGVDSPISNFIKAISPYVSSKAELNYRNVNNNLQSGIIYNNYLTSTVKALSDPEVLTKWIEDKMRNPAEYAYSSILIDNPEQGIRGIARYNPITHQYEPTEYAPYLINLYLFNGIKNNTTDVAKDYTNMSDADYFLSGYYAFHRNMRNYRSFDIPNNVTVPAVAPYLLRIPSDAPKNFAVTLPKYSIGELYNWDQAQLKRYVDETVTPIVNKTHNQFETTKNGDTLKLVMANNLVSMSKEQLGDFVVNIPESYTITGSKIVINDQKTGEIIFGVATTDKVAGDETYDGVVWFKGKGKQNGTKWEITNIEYLGLQQDGINQRMLYTDFYAGVRIAAMNKARAEHNELRSINRNSAIFNILRNTVLGEIAEYYEAKAFIADPNNKDRLIDNYHTGKKNALHIMKLDNSVYDIGREVERMLSSTGEQPFILMSDGKVNPTNDEVSQRIDELVEAWIENYNNYSIDYVYDNYSQYFENESFDDIAEYMFNAYIANMQFDDLFEGNSKYYKNSQTFLKRTKQVQASGTGYASNYSATPNNANPFIQSVTNTGESIQVGGRTINIRTGWNAITIKNVEKASDYLKEIRAGLEKTNLSKEQIDALMKPFGEKQQVIDDKNNGEDQTTKTTIDDAQSYITIYELARRAKLLGEYPRYEKLINQLTDDTTKLEDINPNELTAFIQITKNFYYDQYFDPKLGRHVSRQIKNAEFVLIPKFLGEDTSLGRLAKIMIENDIDQVNTKETSKATNYEVLEYWDERTGEEIGNSQDFIEKARKYKKPYSYMYLYRQQEVPQHMLDEQNKAGIQIMKKVLDNLMINVSQNTRDAAGALTRAYVANIRESFDELMDKYGVKFDTNGNITTTNAKASFEKIYKLAQEQMARLGADSNMMDYVTIRNNNTGRPVMPNLFNISANKIESVAQSQFNKAITRQKLPGWHGAQTTSVGLEGKIPQIGATEASDKLGKRVQLNYHKDNNVVEILLPKWASSMLNQYDENGNLVREFKIEDLDDKVKTCIGYRIPTEGKQSTAVMKVVGFLPEWMGSTVVVPDEWVTQTGSDFDIDSVYGIAYETYLGKDGRIHAIEYIEGNDDIANWTRYAVYVNHNVGRKIREENATYLTNEEKAERKNEIRKIIEEYNKEEADKFFQLIRNILGTEESAAWEQLSDEQKNELNPIFKNNSIKFKDRVSQIMAKLVEMRVEGRATDGSEAMYNVYEKISKIIQSQIEFNQAINANVYELMKGEYAEYFRNAIRARAATGNLMSYEDFIKQSEEMQNTRAARNNRILDKMIEILNSKDATAENLARSNFDDMVYANELINKALGVENENINIYNPSTHVRYRRNAMSGAMLKAFSVTRDTANSVFNVSRATLEEPIYVRYSNHQDRPYSAKVEFIKDGYDVVNGYVEHKGLANSKNDRNVAGELITVASSHTTAHILDAIKEGAIENENEYTFAAFKTLFDIGMDAYSAILWLRQPGISRLVNCYFETNSVFSRGKFNPVNMAIKQIAKELGVQINNKPVSDYESTETVINALEVQFGKEFTKLTGGYISKEYEENAVRFINIPQIEERMFGTSLSLTGKLLLDLKAILNFDYINRVASTIQQHARVMNPDRFGAKQSIFETRQIFDNIDTLFEKKTANKIYTDYVPNSEECKKRPLLEALYPGLINKGVVDYKSFLSADRSSNSVYPSVYAFLRYSTIPSIIINSNLFDTERESFVEGIKAIGNLINGKVDKQLYTTFKSYVLDHGYKQYCDVISKPVVIDKVGNVEVIKIDDSEGSSPVKDEAIVQRIADEPRRIYGFGYGQEIDFSVANIHKPTTEEIDAFSRLTPAQKVMWIQRHLESGERTIFDYIEANLFDTRTVRTSGVPRQTIQFNDQDVSREALYDMFEEAFFNKNPLIKLTAMDIVKYAFVVEGYKFTRRGVSKLIKNSVLYTSINEGGTGIVDDLNNMVAQMDRDYLLTNNVYDDFIRSHSNIPQIPVYRIKYNKNVPDIFPIANTNGVYSFNLNTAKDTAKLLEMGILEEQHYQGATYYVLNTSYVNLVGRRGRTTLYKAKFETNTNGVNEVLLYPLNKLEEFEHGKFSANQQNNVNPSVDYYRDIINLHINTTQSFKELEAAGNTLFTKEGAAKYRAVKMEVNNPDLVPSDENFIQDLANVDKGNDGAARQFIQEINKELANTELESIWLWNGSDKIKNAFKSTQAVSVQSILDEEGNVHRYTIRRAKIKNIDTKKITDPKRLKGIEAAKNNGVMNIDSIYMVQKYNENKHTVEYKKEDDGVKQSAIDIDDSFGSNANPTNVQVSQLGNLAQQFIVDINTRARVRGDEFASRTLTQIRNNGVIDSVVSTIEEHKIDTVRTAAQYYASKVDEIISRLENFMPDDDLLNIPVDADNIIDLIKDNKELLNDYLSLVLSASTFSDRFPLISNISLDELDGPTKNNIIAIRDAIARLRTNTRLRKAMDMIADKVYGPMSTNPNFQENLTTVSEHLSRDASFLDKLFQDSQELSIPIIQLVLRHANARVHELNLQGRDEVREYNRTMNDIKKRAAEAGMTINWDNIVNNKTGRWRTNFSEQYYEDRAKLLDAVTNAQLNYGKFSKEFILAKRELNQWLLDNTQQEYIDDYYRECLENEKWMVLPANIDYFVEYQKLDDEYKRLLKINKRNRSDEDNKRIKAIRTKIAEMRSDIDYATGEEKPEREAIRARRLDAYIKGITAINDKYFDREARANFNKDLQKRLDIINKYRKYDSNGNPLFSEDVLIMNPEYSNALEWLEDNAVFSYNKEIRDKVNAAFADLTGGKSKYPQFKSIVAHTADAYDSNGTIVGTAFNERQVAAIKAEQEAVYNNALKDNDSTAIKLIRNRQPDEESYSAAFYAKFRSDLNNPPSEDRKWWIGKANAILAHALDAQTGKLYLSRLTIEQLRALANCYDALGNLRDSANKPDDVKQFIENEVEFAVDTDQYKKDRVEAETKGAEFLAAWKAIANEKVFSKGKMIGRKDNSPNSEIYGYVRPKEAVRNLYIDPNATKRREALKFIKEHIRNIPTRYYWEAREQAAKDGKLAEFEEANHVYNPYTGIVEPLRIWTQIEVEDMSDAYKTWGPNFANTNRKPKDRTINKDYKRYSNNYKDNGNKYIVADVANQYEREMRDYLMDKMWNLSKNNPSAAKYVSRGLLPRRRVLANSTANTVRALGNFVGIVPTVDIERGISKNIGYAYDRNHNLPMLETLKDASYKQHLVIREQHIDESNEDYAKYVENTRKHNREIDEYNRKLDVSLMDKDYESVFKEFITRAVDANAKAEVRNELYYLIDYLEKYYEVIDTNTFGNLQRDRHLSTDDRTVYRRKKANNAIEMIKTWTGRLLFDEYKPFSKMDSFVSVLQNVASAKYMMFNITGGVGNILTGATNILMETFAGDYVNLRDWNNAKMFYVKGMSDYILGMDSETSNGIQDAIIKMMAIIDYAGVTESRDMKTASTLPGIINKIKNAAYFPQTSGEHFMQNTMMFAMMNSHRVVNGQIMDFDNYTWDREYKAMRHVLETHPELKDMYERYVDRIKQDANKLKDYLWFKRSINSDFLRAIKNKDIAKEYTDYRDSLMKNAKKEFETYPKVIDQFELSSDGFADLKSTAGFDYKELAYFKGKVVSVNKKIHGIYDKLGGAWIESHWAIGSLIMQYHKHIYNGFMKRFRSNGYWNESRMSRERGVYTDIWNFVTTEFKGIRQRVADKRDEDGTGTFVLYLQELAKAAINTKLNFVLNWQTMDVAQQNNCRRALGELCSIAFTLAGGIAANCLITAAEDDDVVLQFIGNAMLYQMDKLSSETTAYIWAYPELKKTWNNPVAIGSSFNDLFSTLGLLIKFAVDNDDFNPEFETGQYAGENKFKVYIERQIPIYRNIKRLANLDQNNSYYKLGQNMLGIVPVEDIAKWIVDKD